MLPTSELVVVSSDPIYDLVEHSPALFDLQVPAEDLISSAVMSVIAAARQQILAETTETSPWYAEEEEDAGLLAIKDQMFSWEVMARALEIAQRIRHIFGMAGYAIIAEIGRRRLHEFPPDGNYLQLDEALKSATPVSDHPTVMAQLNFATDWNEKLIEIGVDAKRIANIADGKISILGKVAHELNKIQQDPDLDDDEKNVKMLEVIDRAETLPVREFEAHYQGHRVPLVRYQKIDIDSDSGIYVLYVDVPAQKRTLERRLRDVWAPADYNLLYPVTAKQLYDLLSIPNMPPDALPRILKLAQQAVLSDPTCYAVYSLLSNDKHRMLMVSESYLISLLPSHPPARIRLALATLTKYGLLEAIESGMPMWQVV